MPESSQYEPTFLPHSCPKHVVIEKKSPSTFDNKIVNCSHQTTIFHWNWKEKLRFVGGLVVHLQKFPPNLGRIGCVSQVINPTNLNFSFQFQWKMVVWWLQFSILLSNLLGLFFSITTCLGQLWIKASSHKQQHYIVNRLSLLSCFPFLLRIFFLLALAEVR